MHGPLLEGPKWRAGGRERPEDRCSLARLLFGLGQAQLTGVIRVLAPVGAGGEERHELYMRMGRVVQVRPPYLDEPLGHILRDMGLLDHETYARSLLAMAEERARHGTVLRRMGIVSDEQLAGALAVQILRRTARMFRLRGGRYSVDPHEHDYGRDNDVAANGIGVRRVIYNGVAAGYDEKDLVWEMNLLAGRRVRLRKEEARRLGRYGFGAEARGALELLAIGFCEVHKLLEVAGENASTALLKVLYTLLVTEMLEVESSSPPVTAPRERPTSASVMRRLPAPPMHPVHDQGPEPEPLPPPPSISAHVRTGARQRPQMPVAEPHPVQGRMVSAAPGASPELLERFKKGSQPRLLDQHQRDPRAMEGQARFLRGEAYLRKGDFDMALANLRAASTLMPDDPDVKAMLALAVWRAPGDPALKAEQARRHLAEALGRCPTCARAYRVFGEIYAGRGEIEQAIRCFAKVLQLVPDDVDAAREMKRLEKKRSRPGILSLFRKG
jgi:tetratricopeptide (TPR) repeat protein